MVAPNKLEDVHNYKSTLQFLKLAWCF